MQMVGLRLTRDYLNTKRDKRRTDGWHSLKAIPAGTFIAWMPVHDRETPSGKLMPAGGTMVAYLGHSNSEVRVPYEFVSSLLPHGVSPFTETSEPSLPGEVLLMQQWAHYSLLPLLDELVASKKISLADIAQASEALEHRWAQEEAQEMAAGKAEVKINQ